MHNINQLKTSDKVKASINKGFSLSGIAKILEISRPTLYKKLSDNGWSNTEIERLRSNGIIK